MIYPADDPLVAVFSGHGLAVRLDQSLDLPAGEIILQTDDAKQFSGAGDASPGGTRVQILPLSPPLEQPQTQHAFCRAAFSRIRRLGSLVGQGCNTAILIPDRLGRLDHRKPHSDPRWRPCAGHGALSYCRVSVDFLLSRLGRFGLRGPRRAPFGCMLDAA